jgi:hypothetical protein
VVFCVVEYGEALPSIVAILLEWVVAVGFLAGKRVGWLNPITTHAPGARPTKGLIGPSASAEPTWCSAPRSL